MLTPSQNQALKARAHHLKPVVQLGKNGASLNVLQEIAAALNTHELIKVQLVEPESSSLAELAASLCDSTDAELIEVRGKIAVLFKQFPRDSHKESLLS